MAPASCATWKVPLREVALTRPLRGRGNATFGKWRPANKAAHFRNRRPRASLPEFCGLPFAELNFRSRKLASRFESAPSKTGGAARPPSVSRAPPKHSDHASPERTQSADGAAASLSTSGFRLRLAETAARRASRFLQSEVSIWGKDAHFRNCTPRGRLPFLKILRMVLGSVSKGLCSQNFAPCRSHSGLPLPAAFEFPLPAKLR